MNKTNDESSVFYKVHTVNKQEKYSCHSVGL